ncbi:cation:proton antiporter [Pseudaestuariivita atlantica]|uniref:Potassium transporter n=1 Tax=Pseudaestuariivita atlantica TaxID=1317121 RepID=A0A0L1JRI4_9RHOB|nr:cation:proton antiporter [Pseudaestuariivita atlantica]KNG93988.1 potassium transporter [Pseudaestuariivita atlantica]
MSAFLSQAVLYLTAAVICVPLATRLGLGSVLGYLIAGIAISPLLAVLRVDVVAIQHFAEFGVVMMLFLIGLELEPRAVWNMRHRLLGLGVSQVVLTTGLVAILAMLLGLYWTTALAVGMIFSLSSTAIVLQTLSEKGLMSTAGGRSTFSVLLTQDVAVIPILAFLPLLALPAFATLNPDGSIARSGDKADEAHGAMSLVEGLPGWGVTLVTVGAIVAVILAGRYLAGPLFRYIHHTRLREMYVALSLAMVVGIAFLMSVVGLSPALGTFLAGVVLANSEFKHEIESDLEPFKGLLLGLFFITVGAGIRFDVLIADPLVIVALTLGIMVLKGLVLYGLARMFRLRGRDQWLFALGLAQAGEFGFVLISFGLQQSVLPPDLAERLLLVVALSMLVTPVLFILYDRIARRSPGDGETGTHDEIDDDGPVIIAGVGRFGQIVNRLVQSSGVKTVVIDNSLKTIQLMRKFGFKGYFGDPTRPDLLRSAGLAKARVLAVCVDDVEAAVKLVAYARKERPDLHIVARARDRNHVYRLVRAGANDVVRETFDASLRAGRYVLENAGLTEYEAHRAEETFYEHDRHALRALADLWKPDVPETENADYIAKVRELEAELQTALLNQIEVGDAREAVADPSAPPGPGKS